MQQLKTEITVSIPPDYVLVDQAEYQELQDQSLAGVYWTIKDLEKRINKSHVWIKENILYPSKFKKILDVKNGGFVYYPDKQGQKWTFQASKMAQFLDEHFTDIFKEE